MECTWVTHLHESTLFTNVLGRRSFESWTCEFWRHDCQMCSLN